MARYQSRLLAFCRHMLSSKEDAEDVLQEVFAAAFNAMLADDRPINVRPWLYRIARNRSLNHLRRTQAVGVDSMDVHLSEGGTTTADKVHKREEFRLLVSDVQDLPETQRTALLLREIDALSYEQIAEAMETTVPSVKSLLVRARVSLAEAAEARLLTCEEVRDELGEVAEGLRRTSAPVRRHLRTCDRCTAFRKQLRETNKALAAVFPVAPLLLLKKTLLAHLGTTAAASGGTAAAAGGGTAAAGAAAGGALQAGASAAGHEGRRRPRRRRDRHRRRRRGEARRGRPFEARRRRSPPPRPRRPVVNNARSAPVAINSAPQPTATKPARHERAVRKTDKQRRGQEARHAEEDRRQGRHARRRRDPAARAARGRHRGADRHHRLDPARRRRAAARPDGAADPADAGALAAEPAAQPHPDRLPEPHAGPDGHADADADAAPPAQPRSHPGSGPDAEAEADAAPVVSRIRAPTGTSASGRSRMIRPSSSDAPSVSTSDMNGPIWRGGKLTTATTSRPSSSSREYSMICADERLVPISDPKSIVSFQARLARLGEVVDRRHAADPHVDRQELIEVDLGHAACSRPMTFIRRSSAFIANARVSATDTPNSVCSSSSPSIHGGFKTASATGPTSTSVRWIASM